LATDAGQLCALFDAQSAQQACVMDQGSLVASCPPGQVGSCLYTSSGVSVRIEYYSDPSAAMQACAAAQGTWSSM
jgi:hypothetical protein